VSREGRQPTALPPVHAMLGTFFLDMPEPHAYTGIVVLSMYRKECLA
jgi:hypothetical protein